MAMPGEPTLIGVDVSKDSLEVCVAPQGPVERVDNTRQGIGRWLQSLPAGPVCLALEATNTYHLELATEAHARGHSVYLLDGYRLNRYRESIGGRAKTDASDARLLRRYLAHEREGLRPWTPPPQGYVTLQRLLHRRATLVKARVALQQAFAGVPELANEQQALADSLRRLEARMQRLVLECIARLEWSADHRRCQAIEGIGHLTAAGLVMAFRRGSFRSSDAFIAFLGLDVRVRESGRWSGRRKLTKKGDPELRRLLHNAAMQASQRGRWNAFYQRHLARGFTKTQALVVLARKLARLAFALMKNQSEYEPNFARQACMET
jgi:transposase